MGDAADGLPILPHLAGEFYTWLWWASEVQGAVFEVPDPVGTVELWVDARVGALCASFSEIRVGDAWEGEVLPALRRWVGGEL